MPSVTGYNEKLKEMREAWKNLYGSLFKWIVLSGVIGSFIGLIASGFSYAIVWVTSFRQANPMIILGRAGEELRNEPGSDSSPVG